MTLMKTALVRQHKTLFWDDHVTDLISCLLNPRPLVEKEVAITRNAKAFDLQFIFSHVLRLKRQPQHVTFLDSLNFLAMPL
jgi:hypothetical protein